MIVSNEEAVTIHPGDDEGMYRIDFNSDMLYMNEDELTEWLQHLLRHAEHVMSEAA